MELVITASFFAFMPASVPLFTSSQHHSSHHARRCVLPQSREARLSIHSKLPPESFLQTPSHFRYTHPSYLFLQALLKVSMIITGSQHYAVSLLQSLLNLLLSTFHFVLFHTRLNTHTPSAYLQALQCQHALPPSPPFPSSSHPSSPETATTHSKQSKPHKTHSPI